MADEPGQPEPTNSGNEKIPILVRPASRVRPVRPQQIQGEDMVSESPGAMVILSVHVICDCATYSNEARAGRDRKEPSLRNGDIKDLGK
jgi:hypothetical protein